MSSSLLLLLSLLLGGCVLDRTGQSATEAFRRDMILHATRLNNLENQFDQLEARTAHLEELSRARGQDEILRMETLEELRGEVARFRGELEVLGHNYTRQVGDLSALSADASFRLQWLEDRAAQLEEHLRLNPPPPPEPPTSSVAPSQVGGGTGQVGGGGTGQLSSGGGGTGQVGGGGGNSDVEGVTDAAVLLTRAEEHLAASREKPAEALLKRFMELHPTHADLPQAMYRYAEAAFNAKDYSAAVLRFQEVIDTHKDSRWAAWAMLRQGECFDAQNEPENARLFYEDVLRIWPGSDAAKEARQKLRR